MVSARAIKGSLTQGYGAHVGYDPSHMDSLRLRNMSQSNSNSCDRLDRNHSDIVYITRGVGFVNKSAVNGVHGGIQDEAAG